MTLPNPTGHNQCYPFTNQSAEWIIPRGSL